MHFAAAHGNLNVVRLILDERDDIDARGALPVANMLSKKNSLEILNLLEERIKKNEEIAQHLNLQIGSNKIEVTSGTSKPSLWINGLVGLIREKGNLLVSKVVIPIPTMQRTDRQ